MLAAEEAPTLGAQFTCFTGTKVQILTQKLAEEAPTLGAQFTCFTGTKVQILTQKAVGAARAVLGEEASVVLFRI
jgi:hypothetical protein